MKEKEFRRSLAVLPIGTAMSLTGLSARQIRYYEKNELVVPKRNDTNRRMYSLDDIDKLLEIKDYLAEGMTIAEIKKIGQKKPEKISDDDLRRLLREEFISASGMDSNHSGFSFKDSKRHFQF
ncbi:MerR family transcriptional regulator [Ligilactobacillus saerimneri]|uniref:MerR family transcriptional regulator n=1 Tax=Ligilactobacillus saerimneri TaxID=228229 RepID=A0A7H9EJI3_9LACO|nr:MerR family transcriptional regulator [Ligilactobacillus saerimneri]QLL77804.1 MerR family transcriptional regulator [Ligilactobacillus saerimneri]